MFPPNRLTDLKVLIVTGVSARKYLQVQKMWSWARESDIKFDCEYTHCDRFGNAYILTFYSEEDILAFKLKFEGGIFGS